MALTDWLSYVRKGDIEFSRKKFTQAKEFYEEAAKIAPKEKIPQEKLGNFYYFSGRLDAGLKHLFLAFELGSTDPAVFFNLGRIYLLGNELLDRGRYFFDHAATLSPKSEPLIGTYLGVLYYLKGRAEECIEFLSRLRLSSPLREPLEFFMGCANHDLGRYETAEKHYKHALTLEERNEETLLMLGNTRFRQRHYQEAWGCFRQATEVNPEYYPAWHNAGIALQFLGKAQEAADHFQKMATSNIKKKAHRSKAASTEEPGLERHLWGHVEKLLLEGTVFKGESPIVLD